MRIMLDDGAYLPERAYEMDAGYDLRTPYEFTIHPGTEVTIDLGVHVEIPKGYAGFLKSKSGLNKNDGITCEGLIDAVYVGSIAAKLRMDASQKQPKHFKKGDKVTQIVFLEVYTPDLQIVDSLEDTERGSNGFGSTGR